MDQTKRYEICPKCGHDWIAHFAMIDPKTEELTDPYPCNCIECGECDLSLKKED